MKIGVVIVTCNRPALLPRALNSVAAQKRKPDFVVVISNSDPEYREQERELCMNSGYLYQVNTRSPNYSGALNEGAGILADQFADQSGVYFASLDDDDEWMHSYLEILEANNASCHDCLLGYLNRVTEKGEEVLLLPELLTFRDFLRGNPGIGGSNTFVKLETLIRAGGFDENLPATIDRDFFTRLFLLKPSYRIIPVPLVNAFAENNRERVTTNRHKKRQSFRRMYSKYRHLMNEEDMELFLNRAEQVFGIGRWEILPDEQDHLEWVRQFSPAPADLHKLGEGSEGFVFSDLQWVYKSFYDIPDQQWTFLKKLSPLFSGHEFLKPLTFFEKAGKRVIMYPFSPFVKPESFSADEIISFLCFCRGNGFVYSNLKPSNFVQEADGSTILIDYGRSFEPFRAERFLNSVKRGYLLARFAGKTDEEFAIAVSLMEEEGLCPAEYDLWDKFCRLCLSGIPVQNESKYAIRTHGQDKN